VGNVGQPARRTFQYQPSKSSYRSLRTKLLVESVRSWFFSPFGVVLAWLAALALMMPSAVFAVVTLHERISLSLLMLGTWWLAGLIVIQWWIPEARRANRRTEGIAAAGWHVFLTMSATALVAWLLLFREGIHSPFTLAETRPVVLSWLLFTFIFGGIVIYLRGHTPLRTLRYGVFGLSIGAAWMSLWLVLAHSGL
jgi:hypothetical protein